MREILFRGKRTDNYEWIEGSLCTTIPSDEDFYTISYFDFEGYYIEEKVIPETVGQYTGLTDKNGKRIFEGDVIQFCTGMKLHYIVEFGLGGFMVSRYDIRDAIINVYNCPCEVIGNIHDNPELLKGGAESVSKS